MNAQLNNTDECGIEKYEGSFDQDELGVTLIPNETIRILRNTTDLALYTFLASCSKDWKLNAKHLATHFQCNKEKIYKSIDSLIAIGLLSRTISRTSGKFAKYHYRLHIRQTVQVEPFPEKPDTVKPDTVNPDTYKTLNIKNNNINNIISEPGGSPVTTNSKKTQLIPHQDIIDAYHETLPDSPKIKVADESLVRQLNKLQREWPNLFEKKEPFSIALFKNYLLLIKQKCPGFLQTYQTKDGNPRKNNLRTLTTIKNIAKLRNGELTF